MLCSEILLKEKDFPCKGVFWVRDRSHPSYYPASDVWKFDLTIGDKTGDIRLTYFDADKKSIHAKYQAIPKNSFVKVEGKVSIYKGKYYSITVGGFSGGSLEPARKGEYDISQFIKESNRDPDSLLRDIQDTIDEMDDGPLKDLLKRFMFESDFVKKFKIHPGAIKYHHAWKSGLLEHTWEVLNHCKTSIQNHEDALNKDLVYAGAILHDIGKIREIRIGAGGIIPIEEGTLLGHIYLTVEMVNKKINEICGFPQDLKNHLLHILLSHHEKLEQGSPVETMTPEAITIACADASGAKVSEYIRAVNDACTDKHKFYVKPIGWVYKD